MIDIILQSIFASIAATGFAMVFNVPKDSLKFCAIGGFITYMIRASLLDFGLGIEISTFDSIGSVWMTVLDGETFESGSCKLEYTEI